MYGCPEMENYEDFCLRSLALLQKKGKFKRNCEPPCSLKGFSVINFYGRAVLSPLLSGEQRTEMCRLRLKAVQLELHKYSRKRDKLLTQLGKWDQNQVKNEEEKPVLKSATVTGYTLVTDSPGLSKDPGFTLVAGEPMKPSSILNGYRTEKEVAIENQEKSDEEEEDEDISLDSLLKRSREYVKREQTQQGVVHSVIQSPLDTYREERLPLVEDMGIERGFSTSPKSPIQIQTPHDQNPHKSVLVSASKSERYACLTSPESIINTRQRGCKPRPLSTGNIHVSFPIAATDLIPQSPGKSREGGSAADWVEAGSASSGFWVSEGRDGSGNHHSSYTGTSPGQEQENLVSASLPSSMAHQEHLTAEFRRRCHTLDSQLNQATMEQVDHKQERTPRFMAGVTRLAPNRRAPVSSTTQLDKVGNQSPSLKPCSAPIAVSFRKENIDSQGSGSSRKPPTVIRGKLETIKTDDFQWRVQTLENKQRKLEEEHAVQMSVLRAEVEKEEESLSLIEDTDWSWSDLVGVQGDSGGQKRRSASHMSSYCPGLSPTDTPVVRSPAHTPVFTSPVCSDPTSPSVSHPIYAWSSTPGSNKIVRPRYSLVVTVEQLKGSSRLAAMVRGFFVRRLLKTEKLKQLRQTVKDTQEFIRTFKTEAVQRKSTYSAQDIALQERVRAQLRAALYDVHDIFFEMPLAERLALLQQDRELRAERKLRDMEKSKSAKERVILSAATQRSLERKKRGVESPVPVKKIQHKPKSPTTTRVQKSKQVQNSPASGQLSRQGSWLKKPPEDRPKRSITLKKQHSLS